MSPAEAAGLDGAPRWVSGVLAALQGALLSLLVVVVPATAAYVATSADPTNADVGWPQASAVGAGLWLLGHGGTLAAGGALVTITPLGITALAVFTGYASARRSAHTAWSAWLAGTGTYVVAATGVALVLAGSGPAGAGPWAMVRTVLGAALVGAVGLGLGMLRPGGLRSVTRPLWERVPPLLRVSAAAGTLAVAALVAVAGLVTVAWVVGGRAASGDLVTVLGVDTFGGFLLALAQLALAPNLVLWALGWLVGPGFSVGAGTTYAPAEVVTGPLPALPLLGALPSEPGAGSVLPWVPVLLVLLGGLAGWWLHGRLTVRTTWDSATAVLLLGLWAGALVVVLVALAGGSAGPGRLSVVGGPALLTGAVAAGLVALGAAAVALPADATLRGAVVRTLSRRSHAAGSRRDAG